MDTEEPISEEKQRDPLGDDDDYSWSHKLVSTLGRYGINTSNALAGLIGLCIVWVLAILIRKGVLTRAAAGLLRQIARSRLFKYLMLILFNYKI